MPFQVLTAVYLDARGPAHFHAQIDEGDHGGPHHDPGPEHERGKHGHGHYGVHFHTQYHVERHHHHPGDSTVVTVHDRGVFEPLALKEETTSAWSGTMLAALLASSALLLLRMRGGLIPRTETLQQTRFPGPLERPPRFNPA